MVAEEEECRDLSFSDVIRNKHALRKDRVPGVPADYAVPKGCRLYRAQKIA